MTLWEKKYKRESQPWLIFFMSGIWDKVPEGSTHILEIPEFTYNTM